MKDIKTSPKHHSADHIKDTPEPKSEPNSLGLPERKKTGRKVFVIILIVLITAVLCIGGTWYYMNKKITDQKKQQDETIATLNTKVADLESQLKTAQESAAANKNPTAAETKAKIIAAVPAHKYSDLSSVMADQVNVVIAASEKQGNVSKSQAISDMAYLNEGTSPWNFALPAGTITTYKNGSYKTYLASATIFGVSANKYFVAFSLNSDNKISQIFMANSTDSLE